MHLFSTSRYKLGSQCWSSKNQNLIYNNDDDENEDNIFTRINSKYYDIPDINNLSNESSLGILHTNLASLYKYHDDL